MLGLVFCWCFKLNFYRVTLSHGYMRATMTGPRGEDLDWLVVFKELFGQLGLEESQAPLIKYQRLLLDELSYDTPSLQPLSHTKSDPASPPPLSLSITSVSSSSKSPLPTKVDVGEPNYSQVLDTPKLPKRCNLVTSALLTSAAAVKSATWPQGQHDTEYVWVPLTTKDWNWRDAEGKKI
jgi:hypothetical protein